SAFQAEASERASSSVFEPTLAHAASPQAMVPLPAIAGRSYVSAPDTGRDYHYPHRSAYSRFVASERLETVQNLVDLWNAGDLEGYLDAIGPDVEFTPDPSFPHAGTHSGEDLRRWFREWFDTWEGNRLEVLGMENHRNASTIECRWHLSARETQDELPIDDFTLVVWFEEGDAGRPVRIAAFFDREKALQEA